MTPGLLDSSTLSDVIRPDERRSPQVAAHLKLYLARYSQLTFSELSYFEILRGLLKKSASAQIAQFEEFCSRSLVIPVSRPVLGRAAFLWSSGQRQGIVVDDADLIIAATAIEAGISIVTANPKHFRWIEGLDVIDWRNP